MNMLRFEKVNDHRLDAEQYSQGYERRLWRGAGVSFQDQFGPWHLEYS